MMNRLMPEQCMLLAAITAGCIVGLAAAGPTIDEPAPPAPTDPPTLGSADGKTVQPGLAPLLREGSQVQNIHGTLHEVVADGTWRLTMHPDGDAPKEAPRREFIMLPNSHLSEMQQVIGSMPERTITFQVTGEVFVYGNRNYLLLSFPPRVVSEQRATRTDEPDQSAGDASDDDRSRPRSAADIMRDLQRDTGPIGRRPTQQARRVENDQRQLARSADNRLLPENTSVQLRRGRIGRDAGGAWQFIFDADASGMADPPVTLMPCQLLERIEQYIRRAGRNAPVLISGRVFVYNGRNYLLPTVFLIPRERTELNP